MSLIHIHCFIAQQPFSLLGTVPLGFFSGEAPPLPQFLCWVSRLDSTPNYQDWTNDWPGQSEHNNRFSTEHGTQSE